MICSLTIRVDAAAAVAKLQQIRAELDKEVGGKALDCDQAEAVATAYLARAAAAVGVSVDAKPLGA